MIREGAAVGLKLKARRPARIIFKQPSRVRCAILHDIRPHFPIEGWGFLFPACEKSSNTVLQKTIIMKFARFTKTLLLLLILVVIAHGQSPVKIQGYVFDAESAKPLAGANVIVENTTFGAATDANGHFVIDRKSVV